MINKTNIEVRYQETDQMGIVYHANYLIWFEIGRTKFIEQLGFKYAEMEKENIVSPVADLQIKYIKPAKYGDHITIETSLKVYNGIRTVYKYNIYNQNNELLARGTSTHVVVEKESFKLIRLKNVNPLWDQAYRNIIEKGKE